MKTIPNRNLQKFADCASLVLFSICVMFAFAAAILFVESSIVEVISHHYELQSVVTDYVHDQKELVLVSTSSFQWKTNSEWIFVFFLIIIVMIIDWKRARAAYETIYG
jgi:hypothetical protein